LQAIFKKRKSELREERGKSELCEERALRGKSFARKELREEKERGKKEKEVKDK